MKYMQEKCRILDKADQVKKMEFCLKPGAGRIRECILMFYTAFFIGIVFPYNSNLYFEFSLIRFLRKQSQNVQLATYSQISDHPKSTYLPKNVKEKNLLAICVQMV